MHNSWLTFLTFFRITLPLSASPPVQCPLPFLEYSKCSTSGLFLPAVFSSLTRCFDFLFFPGWLFSDVTSSEKPSLTTLCLRYSPHWDLLFVSCCQTLFVYTAVCVVVFWCTYLLCIWSHYIVSSWEQRLCLSLPSVSPSPQNSALAGIQWIYVKWMNISS